MEPKQTIDGFVQAYVRHSFGGSRYPKAVRVALLASATSMLILRATEGYSIAVEYLILGYFVYAVTYVGVWWLSGGQEWDRQQREANMTLRPWQGELAGMVGWCSFMLVFVISAKALPSIPLVPAGLSAFLLSLGVHSLVVKYFQRRNASALSRDSGGC